ncbi:MAG TPA: general secretion pathway protein GspE, partial [Verrucomicrobiales bacterium]|nr:general secretion pathway protein GspE [Verrucomicrobiales bacterium]
MNLNLGIEFNETIQRLIISQLRAATAGNETLSDEAMVRKCSKTRILGAVGRASGLPAFPQIREMADAEFVGYCDPVVLARGMFVPLRRSSQQILLAVANPWDYRADDYCASRFPEDEVLKVVTLASEVSAVIEGSSNSAGPSRAELEAVEVEEFSNESPDFDVTRVYDEPIAQLVASMVSDAIKQHAS